MSICYTQCLWSVLEYGLKIVNLARKKSNKKKHRKENVFQLLRPAHNELSSSCVDKFSKLGLKVAIVCLKNQNNVMFTTGCIKKTEQILSL
jgi:hypothetical protein